MRLTDVFTNPMLPDRVANLRESTHSPCSQDQTTPQKRPIRNL